jgi:AraC-like DNA-binding protein
MQTLITGTWRQIMINILQGGCDARHPSSFTMSRPDGLNNHLLLIIRSHGEFIINQRHYTVEPGYAIIFSPKVSYSYHNPKGDYVDDWLHFKFQNTTDIPTNLPKMNEPFPIGNHRFYTSFIQQILWENIYNKSRYSQENILALFRVLFNHLALAYVSKDSTKSINPFQEELQELRLKIQNTITEQHTIKACASAMGLSESYFQHIYKSFFEVSFQQDIIQMRIDYGKYIIRTTDIPIEYISEICGYTNVVHFYRQFKKLTGITPAKYRKNSTNNDYYNGL